MFNVLIDTCVWLDMAQDPKQTPLLLVVENMVRQDLMRLVVPRVVIDEFKRNRARVAQASARSLKSHVAQVKEAINRVAACMSPSFAASMTTRATALPSFSNSCAIRVRRSGTPTGLPFGLPLCPGFQRCGGGVLSGT